MTPTSRRLTGTVAVAACLVAACSVTPVATGPTTTVAPTTTVPGGAHPAETSASTLRAGVTAALQGDMFLVALATSTIVSGGDPSPARAALANDAAELGSLLSGAFDAATVSKLTTLWKQRDDLFLSYATAKVAHDAPRVKKVVADLDANGKAFAAAFGAADVNLTADALSAELSPEASAITTVIDDQVVRSTSQYADLTTAAALFPHTADLLSAAVAKAHSSKYPGTTTGTAANLRAQVTATLVDHVYLAGIVTATILNQADTVAAKAALSSNTDAFANVFSAVYGDAAGAQAAKLWNDQISGYEAYAMAAGASDASGRAQARSQLDTFKDAFAGFVSGLDSKLQAASVSSSLGGHVDSFLAAVDAQAAKSPSQFDLLGQAGRSMVGPGDELSEGIAEQFPTKYLP